MHFIYSCAMFVYLKYTGLGRVFFLQLLKANVAEVQSTTLTVVIIVHFIRTFVVIAMNGRDSNHVIYHVVPKDPHWLFVGPQYHALHHVHPDRFMASVVKIFDWVAGTAYSLRNKNVAITGSSGAFGSSILSQLQTEGVRNIYTLEFGTHWTYRDLSKVGPIFDKADILILAHGTKNQDAMEANCNSTIRLIRLYMERRLSGASGGRILPEIWYVGSEVEMHPTFGVTDMQRYAHSKRAFVPYARALYDCPHVVYRHIVPAAFQSRMDNAFVSSEWAASSTMWWIRRGARYIPVTYTGIADLNFLKFAFWVRPDKDMVAGIGVGNRFMDTPGEKGRLP
ncbi:predicted protein [Aspergillus terreus NIH2624]|uniref:Fatty acid hydroxylase domain-containing protein n=1 Tax=Aspergillus terreus (strain NIH 2624 / FGSC A1156) TaxID=341663 RepID=Q0CRS8_ASPTN|nr:uncharacterized protein ATEG_03606 [Aspergillus terreus NIH2624]EAU35408.1 predicted protein [Aspergillus terreus NIH2624]